LNREDPDDQAIEEISNRITRVRRRIAYVNDILWSKCITKKRKFNIYETMLKTEMLYDCKTLTEKSKRGLEVTKMDAIRHSMRIS
jgi:hypothetical protein